MTSERMIMLPDWLVEEAASLIEQAGLVGTGVSLAAERLRAVLAQPAAGEPVAWQQRAALKVEREARENGRYDFEPAPPAAAHGDEAVMWVECEPGADQFKRLPKDWLLLLSTKIHTTNPGDRSPNVVFPLYSAMRTQGDGGES